MNNALIRLRRILKAPGCENAPCVMSDKELATLLYECGGNVEAAAYRACIKLSGDSSYTLPDGTKTPDNSSYWLRTALLYRPNRTGCRRRADDVV